MPETGKLPSTAKIFTGNGLFRVQSFAMPMDSKALAALRGVDAARLSRMLKALASPVRLELLQILRSPRLLSEIRLRPERKDQDRPTRVMHRVSVRGHLDSLLRIGAVRTIPLHRDGRLLSHYVLDYGQLFALTEELRELVRLQPESGMLDGTMPAPAQRRAAIAQRPHLALANGIAEGQVFPLRARPGMKPWVIGRSPDADVVLEYDPYASMRNSRITAAPQGFLIEDLASRNGTKLNWEPLPNETPTPLASGDILGVGHSVLVFRQ